MRGGTVKLTTAAVCTAIAVVMCVAAAYLPLSIMPLYIAAFCIFLAFKRAGKAYGALCAVATDLLMFLMTGLSVKWLFLTVMFMPYGIVAYFIHRFTYFKVKTAALRAVCVIALFNATLGVVYLLSTRVLTGGIDLDIAALVDRIGGYPLLALVATLAMLPLDFAFSSAALIVLKRIPVAYASRKKTAASGNTDERADDTADSSADGKKYDIFGYEITEKENVNAPDEDKTDGEKENNDE
ncbi:MAG: ECF transporter S component [Roseburia sp.]|nr:ECF transporter S component [Roseburia sp.]